MPYKILVVEDDPTIQRELVTLLQAEGYEAAAVVDFSTTLSQVNTVQPHLILLDIKLPGQSGFSLCSQIRAFSTVPIIFVTSCNTDMDELSSILLGGDAFITKPYHTAILLAKIAALLRRAYPDQPGQVLTLWRGGTPLGTQPASLSGAGGGPDQKRAENPLLSVQTRRDHLRPGDLVSYLWDNQLYVDDNALSVNIGRIREKLSTLGLENFIKTKHRQGYTL